MSKSIEQDTQKSQKKVKIAKMMAVVAAVLLVGWTIYSVAMNLNRNERKILDAWIHYYQEADEPASYILNDCSKIYGGTSTQEKPFSYVIIEVEQGGKTQNLLLIVDGENKGSAYTQEDLADFDCADKQALIFEINEHEGNVNVAKVRKTLKRYWEFHDVA